MAHRAGSADLPLHGGRVPPWLADRMTRLGAVISQAIVHHDGRDEVRGTPSRFSDLARFSLALGRKDRHPFPVQIKVYDQTLSVLKSAKSNARLGREKELGALKRLDRQARLLEQHGCGPTLDEHLRAERAASHSYADAAYSAGRKPRRRPRTRRPADRGAASRRVQFHPVLVEPRSRSTGSLG